LGGVGSELNKSSQHFGKEDAEHRENRSIQDSHNHSCKEKKLLSLRIAK